MRDAHHMEGKLNVRTLLRARPKFSVWGFPCLLHGSSTGRTAPVLKKAGSMKHKLVAVIAAVTLSIGSGATAAVAAVGPTPPPVTVTSDAAGSVPLPVTTPGGVQANADSAPAVAVPVTPTPEASTAVTDGSATAVTIPSRDEAKAGSAAALAAAVAPEAPSAPTGVSPTDTSINLSWTPPADGGSPITQYYVNGSADGGQTWPLWGAPATPTGTTLTLTELTPATPYQFRVVAQNSVGYGAWSATGAVSTP